MDIIHLKFNPTYLIQLIWWKIKEIFGCNWSAIISYQYMYWWSDAATNHSSCNQFNTTKNKIVEIAQFIAAKKIIVIKYILFNKVWSSKFLFLQQSVRCDCFFIAILILPTLQAYGNKLDQNFVIIKNNLLQAIWNINYHSCNITIHRIRVFRLIFFVGYSKEMTMTGCPPRFIAEVVLWPALSQSKAPNELNSSERGLV
jgi:hypothetical protein